MAGWNEEGVERCIGQEAFAEPVNHLPERGCCLSSCIRQALWAHKGHLVNNLLMIRTLPLNESHYPGAHLFFIWFRDVEVRGVYNNYRERKDIAIYEKTVNP